MQHFPRIFLGNAAVLGALLAASPAFAHIDLLDPPARAHGTAAGAVADDVNTDQKTEPCGQVTNGRNLDRVTTYAPGQTITVQVAEETNHDSYIRVTLDTDGDDDFVYREPVAPATTITPETQEVAQAAEEALDSEHLLKVFREDNTANGTVFNIAVTLPDVTCTNCTLQVIQLMYNANPIYYHQCADLIISGDAGPAVDAGVGGTGGTGGAGGAAAGTGGAGGTAPSGAGGSTAAAGTAGTGAGGTPAAAGTGGSGGASATGGSAPVTSDPDDDDGGGCAITTHADRSAGSAGLAGLLALGLGLVARRRR